MSSAANTTYPTSSVEVLIHSVDRDGLPDMEDHTPSLVGRVAFIFDGGVFSGCPLTPEEAGQAAEEAGLGSADPDEVVWECSESSLCYTGVTHWLEFPVPVWELV